MTSSLPSFVKENKEKDNKNSKKYRVKTEPVHLGSYDASI